MIFFITSGPVLTCKVPVNLSTDEVQLNIVIKLCPILKKKLNYCRCSALRQFPQRSRKKFAIYCSHDFGLKGYNSVFSNTYPYNKYGFAAHFVL